MGRARSSQSSAQELVVAGERWRVRRHNPANLNGHGVTFVPPRDGKERFVSACDIAAATGLEFPSQISDHHLIAYIRKNHTRLLRKRARGERSLTLGGEVWGWSVGRNHALIVAPSGKKTAIALTRVETYEVAEVDADGFEHTSELRRAVVASDITARIDHCCTCCGEPDGTTRDVALPAVVARYIKRHRTELA